MKTPHNDAAEFIAALETMGFKRKDIASREGVWFDLKGTTGNIEARVILDYEGEPQIHRVELVRFMKGERSQVVDFCSGFMSAHLPTEGLVALFKASIAN